MKKILLLIAAILSLALPAFGQYTVPTYSAGYLGKPTSGTPTFSPGTGSYGSTQSVTISATGGSVICYNTTGSPATNGTTGCTTGTLYTGAVSVSTSETLYAVSGGTGYTDSSVGSATYTISASAPTEHAWEPSNASNVCHGSGSCGTNTDLSTMVDFGTVGGDNLTQGTSASRPTWTASGLNSLATAAFNGTSGWMAMGSALYAGSSFSCMAVFNTTTLQSSYLLAGNGTGAIAWGLGYTGNAYMILTSYGGSTNAIDTAGGTMSTGTWYVKGITYDNAGTCKAYECTGGSTCTANTFVGSCVASDFAVGMNEVGARANGAASFYAGSIAGAYCSSGVLTGAQMNTVYVYIHGKFAL